MLNIHKIIANGLTRENFFCSFLCRPKVKSSLDEYAKQISQLTQAMLHFSPYTLRFIIAQIGND